MLLLLRQLELESTLNGSCKFMEYKRLRNPGRGPWLGGEEVSRTLRGNINHR